MLSKLALKIEDYSSLAVCCCTTLQSSYYKVTRDVLGFMFFSAVGAKVTHKNRDIFFQNFVAFSECIKFITACPQDFQTFRRH